MSQIVEKYPDEVITRNYWLGKLTASEAEQFEREWFSNDESTEYLSAVRDELIEDYIAGELSESDESSFKSYFLQSPAHVQMLALSDVYRRATKDRQPEAASEKHDSWWAALMDQLRGLFGQPLVGLAAATVLIVAIGGVLILLNRTTEPEVASVSNHSVAPQDSPESTVTREPDREPSPTSNTKEDSPTPRPKPQLPTKIVAVVLTGISRNNSDLPVVDLADDVKTVRLVFLVPGITDNFDGFHAVVANDVGQVIVEKKLQDLTTIQRDSQLNIDIPATRFKHGSYTLSIIGKKSGSEDELLHRSGFKVD